MKNASRGRALTATAVAVAVVLAACTGGDDSANGSAATTTVTAAAADSEVERTVGLPEIDLSEYGGRVADVVDAAADERCDRLGYPCAWADVDPDERARSFELAEHLHRVIDEPDDPIEGFVRALAELEADPDVVEIIADVEFATGVLFRLAGQRPVFVATPLSSPLALSALTGDETGDEIDPDDLVTFEEIDASDDASDDGAVESPQGFRAPTAASPRPISYHPVGGPLRERRAIVLEPYATDVIRCPRGLGYGPDDTCFGEQTWLIEPSRNEGAAIAAIMGNHEQISVTHLQGSAVDPAVFATDLSDYDLVHIASHGSAACAPGSPGIPDPDRCYSLIAFTPVDQSDIDRLDADLAAAGFGREGYSYGRDMHGVLRVWITDELLRRSLGREAIAFLSACQTAAGQIFREEVLEGEIGFFSPDRSIAGWNGNSRKSTANRTAIQFWSLMVDGGVEFDLAVERLGRSGLDWTWEARAGFAEWKASGRNQRARDVITITEIDTRTQGRIGDGSPQVLPRARVEVEGVRRGTAQSTVVDLLVDGVSITGSDPISVADGRLVRRAIGFDVWTVPLVDLELPFDLSLADVDPSSPRVFEFEARVSDDGFATYSAHRITTTLSGELAATANLQTFDDLANQISAVGGSIDDNVMRLRFRSDAGPVIGRFVSVMSASGVQVGRWEIDFEGNYDPASGAMEGTMSGFAEGGAAGIFASDDGAGTWNGRVDLETGEFVGTIEAGGQVEPFSGWLAGAPEGDDSPDDWLDDLGPLLDPTDEGALVG